MGKILVFNPSKSFSLQFIFGHGGAAFTGKVRSIQRFGAFTNGVVHVSQLSDSFVKEVGSVVSVGQEVKVRLIEANMETGRISLSMCEGDDSGKG